MHTADIAFYRTYYSFSASVIRKLQKNIYGRDQWFTECNHTAVCVAPPNIILDTVMPKLITRPANEATDRTLIAIARPNFLNNHNQIKSDTFLNKFTHDTMLNTHYYSEWQVLGMLYYGVAAMAHFPIKKNPIRGGEVCTESVIKFKKDYEKTMGISDPLNDTVDESSLFPATLLSLYGRSQFYRLYKFI
jgi:hypothetical protein